MISTKNTIPVGIVYFLLILSFSSVIMAQDSGRPDSPKLARPDMEFKIFQFPKDAIPRVDGMVEDWEIVPDSYKYNTSLLNDTEDGHGTDIDPDDLDVQVTVGWVRGENRLYFLYEAWDNFWDFGRFNPEGYMNDIFEIVVDGDLSGGDFIFNRVLADNFKIIHRTSSVYVENYMSFAGVHAQNYHIYTPPVNNAWGFVWGAQPWAGEFPYANFVYSYDFKPGESGRLILECWITPFDYAPFDGPEYSVQSRLVENRFIGLSWSILDFDGKDRDGHYNLSHNAQMVRNASYLCAFRLMPMEDFLLPELKADWSFKIVDMDRRMVSFHDESIGKIISWSWDFGDGSNSSEQNPVHFFDEKGVHHVITLEVKGPGGSSKRTRYGEVMIR